MTKLSARKMACAVFLLCAATAIASQAQYKVLYSFGTNGTNDGVGPISSLVLDNAGNLYGTTPLGGTGAAGVVFELSPQSDGSWNETILYNFCSLTNCLDGKTPEAALVMDAAGNLYGATEYGGNQFRSGCNFGGAEGCGTAFELSPQSGGWIEKVIYNFCSDFDGTYCTDGMSPVAPLTFDASGSLYGTSEAGGGGDVFKLTPSFNGWTETVLYNFCSIMRGQVCVDGDGPMAGVTFNESGKLFGTTKYGGRYRHGVVFELSPGGDGWTEEAIFDFYVSGGSVSPVSFDSAGNLYSTCPSFAFQLNAKRQTYHLLSFSLNTGDQSYGGLLVDGQRNALFGTAANQGATGFGTVWEVNPAGQLVPVYNFCSQPDCADGAVPESELIKDQLGNLYGTAKEGGNFGNGVVYQVTP
jgi:uncharacterized repeat protein (TIGR03803 family)